MEANNKAEKIFIPVAYLHTEEAKGAMYVPNYGDGVVYTREDFSKKLKACLIKRAVVYDLAFRIY